MLLRWRNVQESVSEAQRLSSIAHQFRHLKSPRGERIEQNG